MNNALEQFELFVESKFIQTFLRLQIKTNISKGQKIFR